ncbi:hypothetical protein NM208_g8392 [Fusarium decemcellulare]|uniref:Uncharacterized protein n=1 Tax=Fusarium decemcellulare TaxID=57161 RepID=A0ACC1S5G7_9HYPO|nr:hypothetical protein NM208_g8392 [Fusarium decemcellulare]
MTANNSTITIETGYRPGFLARCLEMHIAFYHPSVAWGLAFETSLAKDFADLIERLENNPRNQIWAAVQKAEGDDPAKFTQQIVGTVLVDSESLKTPNTAHIRGFIVDERVRGFGVGKKLLGTAMEFIQEKGFDKVTLFTTQAQGAAMHLYRKAGFVVERDEEKVVWEKPLKVLQLSWQRPGMSDQILPKKDEIDNKNGEQ